MEEFSNNLKPERINEVQDEWILHILCFLRLEITEFLLQNINKEFFDFNEFYKKFKVVKQDIKTQIMDKIIQELKEMGWYVGTIFGDTAIVIHTSEDSLKKCLWAGSFDFSIK